MLEEIYPQLSVFRIDADFGQDCLMRSYKHALVFDFSMFTILFSISLSVFLESVCYIISNRFIIKSNYNFLNSFQYRKTVVKRCI